jgi:hypothetical protein
LEKGDQGGYSLKDKVRRKGAFEDRNGLFTLAELQVIDMYEV